MFLSKEFVDGYSKLAPDWGPVGEITYRRTYSRAKTDGDLEEWFETCERVVNGIYAWQGAHCELKGRPFDLAKAQKSAEKMYSFMFDMKFLPPGRGLANMGTPAVEKSGASVNNCGFVSTCPTKIQSISDPFCWAMDMLMLGVGVGFDTEGAGRIEVNQPLASAQHFVISDCRESWVTALSLLLRSYTGGRCSVTYDYSEIRSEGSPIKGSGGVSSGHKPLEEMLEGTRAILAEAASHQRNRAGTGWLTATHINDIFAMIGRCVVSGGGRRSAQIAFGSPESFEFTQLKNRDTWPEQVNNYRWAANHSLICNETTDYADVLKATEGVAELGVFWLDNARKFGRMSDPENNLDNRAMGANPCAEQTLEHKELCCLVEVFPSRISSEYEFQEVLKYAYLYAKAVTCIPVHDHESNAIVKRNRRIGCSLTGIQQAISRDGLRNFMQQADRGYNYLKQLDIRYSVWLDVPTSIKITSVKPSGTVSKLPGVTSGMHWAPAKAYYQVIRFASNKPIVQKLREAGHRVVDLEPKEPNTTAVYFGVVEKHFSKASSDVSMWEQMEMAAQLQHYWSDNQVSCTVTYKNRDDVADALAYFAPRLKSISFFPEQSHGMEHAPWQPAELNEVQRYIDNCKKVKYRDNVQHDFDDSYCDSDSCVVKEG